MNTFNIVVQIPTVFNLSPGIRAGAYFNVQIITRWCYNYVEV